MLVQSASSNSVGIEPQQLPPNSQARIVFAGCARNCSAFIPAVRRNVERMAGLFRDSAVVIFENDSDDATKQLLHEWKATCSNVNLLLMDGICKIEPVRTRRLEFARNTLIEYVRSRHLAAFDLLILIDLDDVNARELDLGQFERALEFIRNTPHAAAVFANQLGTYYDMWALRHPTRCPGDVWEAVFDEVMAKGCTDEEAFASRFECRIPSLDPHSDALEVDSAFGGLGIYRLDFVVPNPNPYLGYKVKLVDRDGSPNLVRWQTCEHVHFHRGLRSLGGKLFILPWLINGDTGAMKFPPSAWRSMLF